MLFPMVDPRSLEKVRNLDPRKVEQFIQWKTQARQQKQQARPVDHTDKRWIGVGVKSGGQLLIGGVESVAAVMVNLVNGETFDLEVISSRWGLGLGGSGSVVVACPCEGGGEACAPSARSTACARRAFAHLCAPYGDRQQPNAERRIERAGGDLDRKRRRHQGLARALQVARRSEIERIASECP